MECKLFQEPTPARHHSYGFDGQKRVHLTNQLEERSNKILQSNSTRFKIMQKMLLRREDEYKTKEGLLIDRKKPKQLSETQAQDSDQLDDKGVEMTAVPLRRMHGWRWATQTESQNIGWFADQQREPRCKFRQHCKHYSFV